MWHKKWTSSRCCHVSSSTTCFRWTWGRGLDSWPVDPSTLCISTCYHCDQWVVGVRQVVTVLTNRRGLPRAPPVAWASALQDCRFETTLIGPRRFIYFPARSRTFVRSRGWRVMLLWIMRFLYVFGTKNAKTFSLMVMCLKHFRLRWRNKHQNRTRRGSVLCACFCGRRFPYPKENVFVLTCKQKQNQNVSKIFLGARLKALSVLSSWTDHLLALVFLCGNLNWRCGLMILPKEFQAVLYSSGDIESCWRG